MSEMQADEEPPVRILVVEDDRSHRETLARHFCGAGHQVLAVESAERGLGALKEFGPELVITDIRMPGLSGFDLLEKISDVDPDLGVVMITAADEVQTAIDAMKRGAYDYLVKPLDLDCLDEVVDRWRRERELQARSDVIQISEDTSIERHALVGRDPRMLEIYKLIGKVAFTDASVLIRGETGTGKELVARTIHGNSPNADEPFIPVNCAAIPESLLESELFGHVKGAFTGAISDRKGRFEQAGRGSIFLDEIGDTEASFQAKILRVLQDQDYYPVGSDEPKKSRARVLAATHRPIEEMVEEGTFREDLYFRLRVIEIHIPPLRERRSDIPLLARHVVARAARKLGVPACSIAGEAMRALISHDWPGNVRELENTVTRAVLLTRGNTISSEHLAFAGDAAAGGDLDLDDESLDSVERAHVQKVLLREKGNKSRTANILSISRPRLDRIIDKYHLVVS